MIDIYLIQLDIFIVVPTRFYLISALFLVILNQDLSIYCLDLYGSSLWNYSKDRVNDMFVAWCKVVRRLWKVPNMTHCNLLSTINSSLPI